MKKGTHFSAHLLAWLVDPGEVGEGGVHAHTKHLHTQILELLLGLKRLVRQQSWVVSTAGGKAQPGGRQHRRQARTAGRPTHTVPRMLLLKRGLTEDQAQSKETEFLFSLVQSFALPAKHTWILSEKAMISVGHTKVKSSG